MQQPDYSISTPENVDLHLELAGIGNRMLAQLVDTLIITAAIIVLIIIGVVAAVGVTYAVQDTKTRGVAIAIIVMALIFFMFVMQYFYFFLFEGAWQGQTPGKRAAEIRVIEQNGQPLGWPAAFIRNLLRLVDNIFFIGVIFVMVDKTERRLGDMAGGTMVIRERKTAISGTELKMETGAAADLSLDVGRVSPDEYDLLIDFLRRRLSLSKTHRPQVAQRMAQHFRAKIEGTAGAGEEESPRPTESNPEQFLESVYLTYQQRALDA